MLAMQLDEIGEPLRLRDLEEPVAGPGELVLRVLACGVCRTDLHIVDGELAPRCARITPGHEIVGHVERIGDGVEGVAVGQRMGVPWLGGACGRCAYCRRGAENLCEAPEFTGYTRDGGYAQKVVANAAFCFPIPEGVGDVEAAPLMCAGLIGFRAWRKACEGREVRRLGLYGFGAAAHLLAQLAIAKGQTTYAFTRPGDDAAQDLARAIGCDWAGGSDEAPPERLDAAIIFAPVGALVPQALRVVDKGGVVVCAGIHMSDVPGFPYSILWEERAIVSVANLTRADARDYLPMAVAAGVRAHCTTYALNEANRALADLRQGAFAGAAVLVP